MKTLYVVFVISLITFYFFDDSGRSNRSQQLTLRQLLLLLRQIFRNPYCAKYPLPIQRLEVNLERLMSEDR